MAYINTNRFGAVLLYLFAVSACATHKKGEAGFPKRAVSLDSRAASLKAQKMRTEYAHALQLLRQGGFWSAAKMKLAKVFASPFLFNEKAYNETARLLRRSLGYNKLPPGSGKGRSGKDSISYRNGIVKDDIYNFINKQEDFFRYVTLPYYRVSAGHGFDVELLQVQGKVTAFYFTAPWCSFCHKYRRQLLSWAETTPQVVLREIDLLGKRSPAAVAFRKLHRSAHHQGVFVPALFIYDRGKLIYSGAVKPLLEKLDLSAKTE